MTQHRQPPDAVVKRASPNAGHPVLDKPEGATKQYAETAVAFAKALVEGNFDRAHELLSPELRRTWSPDALRDELATMHSYADGEPTEIWYDDDRCSMEDWPGKLPGDVGWAYVGIMGDGWNEAVTVIVAVFDRQPLIRSIEWGRP